MKPTSRPTCLALLICDAVVTDRATGKFSILGTFGEILGDGLPIIVPQLTVYAELTNGEGEADVVLRLSLATPARLTAARDILGRTLGVWEFPIVFDSPLRIYNLHITASNLYLIEFGD